MVRILWFNELLSPTVQSEEDKQLQDELEMLVERLGVSPGWTSEGNVFGCFPFVCSISFGGNN